MLHPLPLPLSSCLGCIPPLIGLPSLRFYAVGSSLFLLSVCFCLCSLFYRDDVLCWLLLARPFLYAFHAHLRFPVDLVWFRLSCDHGWIRSGSVNVRKQQQQQQLGRPRRRISYKRGYCFHNPYRLALPWLVWHLLLPTSLNRSHPRQLLPAETTHAPMATSTRMTTAASPAQTIVTMTSAVTWVGLLSLDGARLRHTFYIYITRTPHRLTVTYFPCVKKAIVLTIQRSMSTVRGLSIPSFKL